MSKVIAIVKVSEYDHWMVNEYNGKYTLVDCWESRDDGWVPSWCTIKTRKGGEMKIPKGLGGRFDSLDELLKAVGTLYGKIKKAKEREEERFPQEEPVSIPDDDIPF